MRAGWSHSRLQRDRTAMGNARHANLARDCRFAMRPRSVFKSFAVMATYEPVPQPGMNMRARMPSARASGILTARPSAVELPKNAPNGGPPMFEDDPEIETSPFSGNVTQGRHHCPGRRSYRIAGSNEGWSLEMVDAANNSVVWDDAVRLRPARLQRPFTKPSKPRASKPWSIRRRAAASRSRCSCIRISTSIHGGAAGHVVVERRDPPSGPFTSPPRTPKSGPRRSRSPVVSLRPRRARPSG